MFGASSITTESQVGIEMMDFKHVTRNELQDCIYIIQFIKKQERALPRFIDFPVDICDIIKNEDQFTKLVLNILLTSKEIPWEILVKQVEQAQIPAKLIEDKENTLVAKIKSALLVIKEKLLVKVNIFLEFYLVTTILIDDQNQQEERQEIEQAVKLFIGNVQGFDASSKIGSLLGSALIRGNVNLALIIFNHAKGKLSIEKVLWEAIERNQLRAVKKFYEAIERLEISFSDFSCELLKKINEIQDSKNESETKVEPTRCALEVKAEQKATDKYQKEFFTAVVLGDHYKVQAMIYKNKVDVNAVNQHGCTALMLAVCWGNFKVLRVLIAYRADPTIGRKDTHSGFDQGPLAYAQRFMNKISNEIGLDHFVAAAILLTIYLVLYKQGRSISFSELDNLERLIFLMPIKNKFQAKDIKQYAEIKERKYLIILPETEMYGALDTAYLRNKYKLLINMWPQVGAEFFQYTFGNRSGLIYLGGELLMVIVKMCTLSLEQKHILLCLLINSDCYFTEAWESLLSGTDKEKLLAYKTATGETLFTLAARRGDLGKLAILAGYGATPFMTNNKGLFPLEIAELGSFYPEEKVSSSSGMAHTYFDFHSLAHNDMYEACRIFMVAYVECWDHDIHAASKMAMVAVRNFKKLDEIANLCTIDFILVCILLEFYNNTEINLNTFRESLTSKEKEILQLVVTTIQNDNLCGFDRIRAKLLEFFALKNFDPKWYVQQVSQEGGNEIITKFVDSLSQIRAVRKKFLNVVENMLAIKTTSSLESESKILGQDKNMDGLSLFALHSKSNELSPTAVALTLTAYLMKSNLPLNVVHYKQLITLEERLDNCTGVEYAELIRWLKWLKLKTVEVRSDAILIAGAHVKNTICDFLDTNALIQLGLTSNKYRNFVSNKLVERQTSALVTREEFVKSSVPPAVAKPG